MRAGLIMSVILWALIFWAMTGCAGFEAGFYARRTDAIETKMITTPPKTGFMDAVVDWLFVDHDEKGRRA